MKSVNLHGDCCSAIETLMFDYIANTLSPNELRKAESLYIERKAAIQLRRKSAEK